MSRSWIALMVVAVAACVDPSSTLTDYAPARIYHEEISLCRERGSCERLCTGLFEVRVDEIAACSITSVDDHGAYVRLDLWVDVPDWEEDDY